MPKNGVRDSLTSVDRELAESIGLAKSSTLAAVGWLARSEPIVSYLTHYSGDRGT